MKIEVIAIADEILKGMIVNTNSSYISASLASVGLGVTRHTVLSDDPVLLRQGLKEALNRADIVICTGGLGPTLDDVTRSIAAEIFSSDFQFRQEIADDLAQRFGKDLSSLKDQATVPSKANILLNNVGTAPGFVFKEGGKTLILMPGVPKEMYPMFEQQVIASVKDLVPKEEFKYTLLLHLCSLTENKIDPLLRDLAISFPAVEIGIYPGYGTLSISLRGKDEKEVLHVKKMIEDQFSTYLFTSSSGKIEEAVFSCLKQQNKTLSFAESCTGGLMAHKITSLAGASDFFLGSIVCYSNQMKEDLLKVPRSILESKGAVSEETVIAMAEGLFSITPCDIAISISGIAGPSGGSAEKPVGTVWVAIGFRGEKIHTFQLSLKGVRETIILSATNRVLAALYRKMQFGIFV